MRAAAVGLPVNTKALGLCALWGNAEALRRDADVIGYCVVNHDPATVAQLAGNTGMKFQRGQRTAEALDDGSRLVPQRNDRHVVRLPTACVYLACERAAIAVKHPAEHRDERAIGRGSGIRSHGRFEGNIGATEDRIARRSEKRALRVTVAGKRPVLFASCELFGAPAKFSGPAEMKDLLPQHLKAMFGAQPRHRSRNTGTRTRTPA